MTPAQSVRDSAWFVVGIALSLVNGIVLSNAAVISIGGPFDNSPFALPFLALALVGPISACVSRHRARHAELDVWESRRRAGRVLVGVGLPASVVSLFLLVV